MISAPEIAPTKKLNNVVKSKLKIHILNNIVFKITPTYLLYYIIDVHKIKVLKFEIFIT